MLFVWTLSPQTLTQHQPSSFIGWLRLANARSWHVVMSNSLNMTNAVYGQDGSGSLLQTAAHFLNTTTTGNRNKCLKEAVQAENWRRDQARELAAGTGRAGAAVSSLLVRFGYQACCVVVIPFRNPQLLPEWRSHLPLRDCLVANLVRYLCCVQQTADQTDSSIICRTE
jgi:hypothetical protein